MDLKLGGIFFHHPRYSVQPANICVGISHSLDASVTRSMSKFFPVLYYQFHASSMVHTSRWYLHEFTRHADTCHTPLLLC